MGNWAKGEHEGAELIVAERRRQKTGEGYTSINDDLYVRGELMCAATCYLDAAYGQVAAARKPPDQAPMGWPWDEGYWKPKDAVANLVRAGALIAAEIDRLHRDIELPTVDPEKYM